MNLATGSSARYLDVIQLLFYRYCMVLSLLYGSIATIRKLQLFIPGLAKGEFMDILETKTLNLLTGDQYAVELPSSLGSCLTSRYQRECEMRKTTTTLTIMKTRIMSVKRRERKTWRNMEKTRRMGKQCHQLLLSQLSNRRRSFKPRKRSRISKRSMALLA
ncbi:hypothetical protein F5B20DRAFT_520014 [Whalleya microplaca]|nr:hypothetical protein F5B20DRAFT_520014 [Whalleya microplaca]